MSKTELQSTGAAVYAKLCDLEASLKAARSAALELIAMGDQFTSTVGGDVSAALGVQAMKRTLRSIDSLDVTVAAGHRACEAIAGRHEIDTVAIGIEDKTKGVLEAVNTGLTAMRGTVVGLDGVDVTVASAHRACEAIADRHAIDTVAIGVVDKSKPTGLLAVG